MEEVKKDQPAQTLPGVNQTPETQAENEKKKDDATSSDIVPEITAKTNEDTAKAPTQKASDAKGESD